MKNDRFEPNHHVQYRYPREIKFCPLCGGELEMRIIVPDNKPHQTCTQCQFVYFRNPKLVAGCLIEDAGRVLLLRRGIEPSLGLWTFPGGYVDYGESPAETAVRETLEEVGMTVTLGALMGIYTDPANPMAAVAVYRGKPGLETPGLSHEATEVRYFTREEIPWGELAFYSTIEALKEWIDLINSR
ncbi:MAG TPA: NUDIX hydrolase [Candidatus Binataceae bacterium]|nr:NUDIX hydrolase [Candidatus Binataceae bacterium]